MPRHLQGMVSRLIETGPAKTMQFNDVRRMRKRRINVRLDRAETSAGRHVHRPISVCIIEDNASFREVVSQFIKNSPDMSVLDSFKTYHQAFDRLKNGCEPDVVLLSPQTARKLTAVPGQRMVSPDYGLTPREKKILELMTQGLTKRKIAAVMMKGYHTVDADTRSIYEKLQVHSRAGAIAKALKEGMLR